MTPLPDSSIAAVAYAAGFRGSQLVSAVSVALAESGGEPHAVNTNTDSYRSRDRGLWQINDHWHPEVSDAQAFDPAACAAAAYRISSRGASWAPWSTWPALALAQRPRATRAVHKSTLLGNITANVSGHGTGVPGGVPSGLPVPPGVPWLIGQVAKGAAGVPDVIGGIQTANDAAKASLVFAVHSAAWIGNPHNWLRVAEVVVGGAGVMVGLTLLAKSGAAGTAAKGAADHATGIAGGAAKLAALA